MPRYIPGVFSVPSPEGPVVVTPGNVYWVDMVNGVDANDGKTPAKAVKKISTAYGHCTANQNDVVAVIANASGTAAAAGGSATAETAALTWEKSFTHLIGMCSPVPFSQRVRLTTSTASLSPFVTISANGCIFSNIQFSNNHSHATAGAVCAKVTGARNYFENCHFQGIGALGVVDNSHRSIVIESSDAENKFKSCTFGTDTVDGVTATNYVMEFSGTGGTARNQFEDCIWLGNGSANSSFILATEVSSLSSFQIFKDCLFLNNDNGTMDPMTQGFALHADNGGLFIFKDCMVYGAATLETTNTGKILVRNAPAAATGDIAIAATF